MKPGEHFLRFNFHPTTMIHSLSVSAAPGRSTRGVALRLALAAAALLTLNATARAQFLLRGTVGDASLQTSGVGAASGALPPTGSPTEYLLTTENSAPTHDGGNVSGNDAVPVQVLANTLYLDPSAVQSSAGNPGTEGSALEFSLQATGATVINFSYDFVTAEDVGQNDANPDFAFATLTPVDGMGLATGPTQVFPLGGVGDPAGNFSTINDLAGTSPFSFEEGYQSGRILTTAGGNYVIGFAVSDANTFDTQSGLFLSTDIMAAAVPEPGVTTLLLLAGGCGVAWMTARRRRARAGA